MLNSAKRLCREIELLGHEAVIAGGAVRDILMGLEPADIDIASNIPMGELCFKFKTYEIGNSKKHATVALLYNGFSFDVCQFRSDGTYSDKRRPDNIKIVSSFKQDVKRRDFTINALGMKSNGEILDYVNGKQDIENKILRTVGNPNDRFNEDYLRILRLARFAAKLDFFIDKATKFSAKKLANKVVNLSPERIADELKKAAKLGGIKFSRYIQILDEIKVLQHILPEVHALKFKPETHGHHPEGTTTFKHTLKALESTKKASNLELLAILFHDIGKSVTHEVKDGKHTYYGHDKAGVPIINEICKRLKLSNEEQKLLTFCAKNHMKFHRIPEMKRSKIVKLIQHENFGELITVCFADSIGNERSKRNTGVLEKIEKVISSHKETKVNSLVDGRQIMKILNIEQGKEVGRIKNLVTEYVIDNNIKDKEEIKKLIIKFGEEK